MMLHDELPFPVVRSWDEAIDDAECDRIAYRDDREFSRLVFLPGKAAMIFDVRSLRDDIAVRIMAIADEVERAIAAFGFAVTRVTGGVDRDGRPLRDATWQPKYVRDAGARRPGALATLTEEERALFGLRTQAEIGAVALQRSFFEPGMRRFFEQPRTSARPLGDLWSRRVAQGESTPWGGSNASAPVPQTPSSVTPSVAPGDATAPAAAIPEGRQ